ncbi:MAG: YfhO family protein [Clostridia bacterium]|nr:YfhO family protein [Clostridia bacterium]
MLFVKSSVNKVFSPQKRIKSIYLRTFLIAFITCIVVFLPFMIYDRGYFFMYGDYNVQQIPFYQMVHDAVRSGDFLWSWTTDLGSNTIGSYAFYLIGSPFFWLTIPFPSSWVPYMVAPLLMLKISLASVTGCAFIKRFVKNKNLALVGGLMYGFSGFSIYNIFFNHFHEAIILLPLLLISLEELVTNDRIGWFALAVFACAMNNYFFFAGQVVFTIIYFFIRATSGDWKLRPRHALTIAFEAVTGLAMAGVIILPAVLTVLSNPRTDNYIEGWNALVFHNSQRYVHILQSLFFPPDIPARPNFTPDSNAKWSSVGAWLPMFGMTGVIGLLQWKKSSWLKRIIWLLLLFSIIPALNASFYLFNSSYYARWFYMLTLMTSLATVIAFEDTDTDWPRAVRWSAGITVAIAAAIGLCPNAIEDENAGEILTFGVMNYRDRLWIYTAIALLSLLLTCIVLYHKKQKEIKKALTVAVSGVLAVTVIFTGFYFGLAKTLSYDSRSYIIPLALEGRDKIDLYEEDGLDGAYRIDVYNGMNNLGMFWQKPCLQTFHSVVPGSVISFYTEFGVERLVASRPEIQKYGLRELLSVKYIFAEEDDDTLTPETSTGQILLSHGYSYYDNQNGFDIYVNDNYVPYGFTFDYYISKTRFENVGPASRHLAVLKALVLSDEQIVNFGYDLLEELPDENLSYSPEVYAEDCAALADEHSYSFERTNHSFTSKIVLEKENMVFFSVPYEDGWSAKVNGNPVKVEDVDFGLMAVRCPAGDNTIEFTYRTPGLDAGLILTFSSALLRAAYWFACFRIKKRSDI